MSREYGSRSYTVLDTTSRHGAERVVVAKEDSHGKRF
jgi:hypothetical protein